MLVDVQTGFAFKLNHVGTAVWRRLDGATDVGTILSDLQREYGVARDQLLQDVDLLFRDLRAHKLIQPLDD